jgi:hypothetical protein
VETAKLAPGRARGNAAEAATAASRRQQRRQRRESQVEARRRIEAQERRRRQLMWAGGALLVVAFLGALVLWLSGSFGDQSAVQTLANQGSVHIQRGQNHPPYNSKPPTSGWHYADAVAPWGISANAIPDEVQVHNLEHGGIMVQYDCPSGCPDMVSKLENIVRSYPSKVVLAPYPGIGRPIALTSWTKLAYLDDVDEGFIRKFIADNKNKAPEQVPD